MSEHHAISQPYGHVEVRTRTPGRPRAESPLRRLAALHDEAAETTRLANMLGRTPWLAALLVAGAAVTFAFVAGFAFEPAPAIWAGFTLAAAFALLRLYRHAVRAPFELASLRAFHADLKAALLYAGCAWGAGVLFAGPQYNLLILLVFSAGMAALLELAMRAPMTALYFAVPAIMIPAVAIAFGPLGPVPAAIILAAGLCVLVAADLAARLLAPRQSALLTVS